MKLYNPNNGQTIQVGIYKQAEIIVRLMQQGWIPETAGEVSRQIVNDQILDNIQQDWIADTTGEVSPPEEPSLKTVKKKGYKPQTEITIISAEETDQKPESEMTSDPSQQHEPDQQPETEMTSEPYQ